MIAARTVLTLALVAALPAAALAQAHGRPGGAPAGRPAPAAQAPRAMPAPQAARPAPAAPAARPAQGFNFNRDLAPQRAAQAAPAARPAAPAARPAAPAYQRPVQAAPVARRPAQAAPVRQAQTQPRAAAPAQRTAQQRTAQQRTAPRTATAPRPAAQNRTANTARNGNNRAAAANTPVKREVVQGRTVAFTRQPPATYRRAQPQNAVGGPYHGRFTGRAIRNSHDYSNYGWNHGQRWNPAPVYWGGGFWGDFALADIGALTLYGSILDPDDGVYYPSYQVQPDTPGAAILGDYNLQQTYCDQPNLVDVWGPDESVICAYPSADVGPGNYEIDLSTFTLIPAS